MRPSTFFLLALLGFSPACTSSSGGGDGDADGNGTDTDTGEDLPEICDHADSSCAACKACAWAAFCEAEITACTNDADCNQLALCVGTQPDPAACAAKHAAGMTLYCASERCALYGDCAGQCEPSTLCPPK